MDGENALGIIGEVAGLVAGEQAIEGMMDVQRVRQLAEREALADKVCPHMVMTPHWDSARDMGDNDRATSLTCDA